MGPIMSVVLVLIFGLGTVAWGKLTIERFKRGGDLPATLAFFYLTFVSLYHFILRLEELLRVFNLI